MTSSALIIDTPKSSWMSSVGSAERWRVSHDFLVDRSGLTKSLLHEVLTSETVAVRDGLQAFVSNLRLNHVPLVIVSAGIRDVIAHTLANCDLPVQGDHLFHIDANYMDFHESGRLLAIYPVDPVHSESKQHVHLRAAHMFGFLHMRARHNPLLPSLHPLQVQHQVDTTAGTRVTLYRELENDPELIIIEPEAGACDVHPSYSYAISHPAATAAAEVRVVDVENQQEETGIEEVDEEVLAIILGDRAPDFTIMDGHPWVHTLRVGFARSSVEAEAGDLFTAGKCDVVFVGEEHSLEAVHLLVDELIQLSKAAAAKVQGGVNQAE